MFLPLFSTYGGHYVPYFIPFPLCPLSQKSSRSAIQTGTITSLFDHSRHRFSWSPRQYHHPCGNPTLGGTPLSRTQNLSAVQAFQKEVQKSEEAQENTPRHFFRTRVTQTFSCRSAKGVRRGSFRNLSCVIGKSDLFVNSFFDNFLLCFES